MQDTTYQILSQSSKSYRRSF